jgi:hypothetical protein
MMEGHTAQYRPEMGDGRGPVAVAVVALVGACVAAFVIGTPALSPRGAPAATAFLSTWRASRTGTFVVDSDFTRTLPDGNKLVSTSRLVQRPPDDRLVVGMGSVAGRLGGKIVRCAAAPDGSSKCLTGADADVYASEVDGELAGLERYVRGDRPLYRVIQFDDPQGRCFRLDLAIDLPSPPYGDHALFCFDRGSLAPSLTVIERHEATDRTQATAIRTTVTDDDVRVNVDPGALVGVPGPTTSTTAPPGPTVTTTTATTAPAN